MRKNNVATVMGLPRKQDYLKTGNDPNELLKIYLDWYDGSIRGADAEIGRLLQALKGMGLDEDTLMVFTSDHGEEFWEHGRMYHGYSVYGEFNQVPLLFRWPNNPSLRKGAMIGKQIESIDIMPTILELAGIQGPITMQGRSLVPLLNGSGITTWEERPAITQAMVVPPRGGQLKPEFGIIDHGWKLVRQEADPEILQELYEHPIDSLNVTNVIKANGAASHVEALSERLEAWKSRALAAQLPSDDMTMAQLSSEELRQLRALGYVGGGTPVRPAMNNAKTTATNTKTDAPVGPGVGVDKKEGGP